MRCEDEQIPAPCLPGRLRRGSRGGPGLQPQEVHPVTTFGLSGAQGVRALDYRGLAAHLADHPHLCRLIDLETVPHFTTFQKAAQRGTFSKAAGCKTRFVIEESYAAFPVFLGL